jgi:hypothetical protein
MKPRTFKHKSGAIAVKHGTGYIITRKEPPREFTADAYVYKLYVSAWLIEDSSDWEEVIEKDYEILRVKNKHAEVFRFPVDNVYDKEMFDIVKVKRLSDGEVFSVGDDGGFGTIKGFEEAEGKIKALHYRKGDWQWLGSLKVTHKPILTSEDGVELYEGDKAFPIYNDENLTILREGPVNSGIDPVENWLYFSTREAAETYRLNNAKVLSKQDIIDCITETSFPYVKWCKVEELVKSRLK